MTFKRLSSPSAGDSTHFGGLDVNKFSDYLGGTDISGTETIDINTLTAFRNSKFSLRNPANTLSYIFVPSAITTANRNVTLPLLTGNDQITMDNHPTTLTNKTIAYGSNTITGLPSGATMIEPAQIIIYIDPADSNKCKVQNSLTGATIRTSSDSTAANVTSTINTALTTDLSAGRTWKETVAFKGNFTVTKIIIPSYTALNFTGANIKQANTTNLNLFENSDFTGGNTQIDIIGGFIDGNKANQTESGNYNDRNTITFKKVSHFQISNTYNANSNGDCLYLEDCAYGRIAGNTLTDAHKLGIELQDSGSRIDANTIIERNVILNTGECWFGNEANDNVVFAHNYCNGIIDASTALNFNGFNTIIDSNLLVGGLWQMIATGTEATALWHGDNSRITNNVLLNCPRTGIIVATNQRTSNVLIANNYIQSKSTSDDNNSSYGIRFAATTRCKAIGNHITGFYRNGILCDGYNTPAGYQNIRTAIDNNTIWNCGKDTGAAAKFRAGIYIFGDSTNSNLSCKVSNNVCYDTAGASGTQQHGLAYETTASLLATNNDFRDNVGAITLAVGTHSPVAIIANNPT